MNRLSGRRRHALFHVGRFGEIISVLVKYGFGDIVARLNIEKFSLLRRTVIHPSARTGIDRKISRWDRVRMALEELGPTFIKLGQFMSNRPDILPQGLIEALALLQDSVRPFPADEAGECIERELGRPPDRIFSEFHEEPVASASVAQVHKATLKNGTVVAVKVQRPRLTQTIRVDIDILFHLAGLVERYDERFRTLRLSQLVEEFERVLEKEIDFTIEAFHIRTFARNFRNDRTIHIPKIYGTYCTRKVLVTEYVTGTKISDIEALDRAGIDKRTLSNNGTRLLLKQIFDHGFFHGDPHPGNILVEPDGTLCFLDFGAVGILPPTMRRHLGVLLYGMVTKDSQRIIRTLQQLSHKPVADPTQLEFDIMEFIEEYSPALLQEINVGDVMSRFARIIVKHELHVIPGFYLLVKALALLEGIGFRLNPEFNMITELKPYVRRLIRMNPRSRYFLYDIYFSMQDLVSLLTDLPFELKDIMRIAKGGELRIQFEHRGLEPMLNTHTQLVNKLVFAMVLASLIIGSSLVVHSGIAPKILDIPVIGIAGFVLAGLTGFALLFSMIRGGKL